MLLDLSYTIVTFESFSLSYSYFLITFYRLLFFKKEEVYKKYYVHNFLKVYFEKKFVRRLGPYLPFLFPRLELYKCSGAGVRIQQKAGIYGVCWCMWVPPAQTDQVGPPYLLGTPSLDLLRVKVYSQDHSLRFRPVSGCVCFPCSHDAFFLKNFLYKSCLKKLN